VLSDGDFVGVIFTAVTKSIDRVTELAHVVMSTRWPLLHLYRANEIIASGRRKRASLAVNSLSDWLIA